MKVATHHSKRRVVGSRRESCEENLFFCDHQTFHRSSALLKPLGCAPVATVPMADAVVRRYKTRNPEEIISRRAIKLKDIRYCHDLLGYYTVLLNCEYIGINSNCTNAQRVSAILQIFYRRIILWLCFLQILFQHFFQFFYNATVLPN